jgi:hypothetical protein
VLFGPTQNVHGRQKDLKFLRHRRTLTMHNSTYQLPVST